MQLGKNFVSDGHFCKSFCPAQPKIGICRYLKHWYHVIIYSDCIMSKNHGLFQNRILRNQFKMAASVMEFKSTTLKNELGKKILLQNQPSTTIFCKLMFLHIPVANIFQCFSIQMLFWVSCYRLDKKICICPSLTQAVSITDTKY